MNEIRYVFYNKTGEFSIDVVNIRLNGYLIHLRYGDVGGEMFQFSMNDEENIILDGLNRLNTIFIGVLLAYEDVSALQPIRKNIFQKFIAIAKNRFRYARAYSKMIDKMDKDYIYSSEKSRAQLQLPQLEFVEKILLYGLSKHNMNKQINRQINSVLEKLKNLINYLRNY